MSRKKILKLLSVVKKEAKRAQERLEENKKASEQTQATARTSWSAAGERVYALGQVEVSKQKYDSLKKLKKELEGASDVPLPEEVIVPCFLCLEPDHKELYLVNNVTNVPGFNLISQNSPLGKVLVGKKVNDKYSLKVDTGIETVGVILAIG